MDTKPAAQDPEASRYLGAPQNTTKAGTRIPLLYGEHQAYGHYLSFDIDAKDVAAGDSSTPITPALTGSNLSQTVNVYRWTPTPVAFADTTVIAPDGIDTITATLTMPNTNVGALTTDANSRFDAGTGVWTVTGSEAVVNASLAAVAFTPAIGDYGDFTIDVEINADGATPLNGEISVFFHYSLGE